MMLTLALASCQTRALSPYNKKGKVFLCLLDKNLSRSTLRVLDMSDQTFEDYELPIQLPHSLIQNAGNPDEVFIFELLGSAVKIDLRSKKVILVKGAEGSKFFGHAVQSSDHKLIWSTEMRPEVGAVVCARNSSDLSLVNNERSVFQGGHHVLRLPGTDLLVSGGSSGTKENFVNFYDPSAGKIVRKLTVNEVPIHMLGISSTEIIGLTNVAADEKRAKDYPVEGIISGLQTAFDFAKPSPLFYGSIDGNTKAWLDSTKKDLFRFNFGIERIPGKDLKYLTSHNHSDSVILWNGYKIERVLNVKAPKAVSVTNDGTQLLVHSDDLELHVFSMENFRLERKIKYDRPVGMISRYS